MWKVIQHTKKEAVGIKDQVDFTKIPKFVNSNDFTKKRKKKTFFPSHPHQHGSNLVNTVAFSISISLSHHRAAWLNVLVKSLPFFSCWSMVVGMFLNDCSFVFQWFYMPSVLPRTIFYSHCDYLKRYDRISFSQIPDQIKLKTHRKSIQQKT